MKQYTKRKKLYNCILLLILTIIFINAKSVNITQSAKSLNDEMESSFTISSGLYCGTVHYSIFNGYIQNIGFQQRFGINKYLEIQLNLDNQLFFNFIIPGPLFFSYIDNCYKFNFFSVKSNNLAIIPYYGVFIGTTFTNVSFSINSGLKFIYSYDIKEKLIFYFGFNFQFAKDLTFSQRLFFDSMLFDFDSGLIFGWEINDEVIQRHEIMIGCFIYLLPYPTISINYSFNIGSKYKRKK